MCIFWNRIGVYVVAVGIEMSGMFACSYVIFRFGIRMYALYDPNMSATSLHVKSFANNVWACLWHDRACETDKTLKSGSAKNKQLKKIFGSSVKLCFPVFWFSVAKDRKHENQFWWETNHAKRTGAKKFFCYFVLQNATLPKQTKHLCFWCFGVWRCLT